MASNQKTSESKPKVQDSKKNGVCLVGLGYMGLPSALLIAKSGIPVLGYDISKQRIETLKKGVLPFDEKGLPELYASAKNNFSVTDILTKELTQNINAYIICVPTPFTNYKTCDLSAVIGATKTVASFLKKGDLVILESTVSPGTTMKTVKTILEKTGLKAGNDFFISYVSEKAIPGNTIYEMCNNARIIGGIDGESNKRTEEIYKSFVVGEIVLTDPTTAEMTKLVENTFRDINIAYANALAKISETNGVNVWDLVNFANKHPRVNVHYPGPGVGGHCIAIDPWFLIERESSELIQAGRMINDNMPKHVFYRMKSLMHDKKIEEPTVAILGVAYKKNVDDSRETPAEHIIDMCLAAGWRVRIHDPFVKSFKHTLEKNVSDAIKGVNLVVIITDHDNYKTVDFSKHIVFDTRNMNIKAKEYYLIGYKGLYAPKSLGAKGK